jgi:hypothetical protein
VLRPGEWTVKGGATDEELAALTAVLAVLLQQAPPAAPVTHPAPARVHVGPWVTRWLGRHRAAA